MDHEYQLSYMVMLFDSMEKGYPIVGYPNSSEAKEVLAALIAMGED